MKIKPTDNWKLLGIGGAELNPKNEYEARWAQNQPDWQDGRKIFTDYPEPVGFLLKQGEYVITEADRPVDLDQIERILQRWLENVGICKNVTERDAGKSASINVNRIAIDQLIAETRNCLADLRQRNNQITL